MRRFQRSIATVTLVAVVTTTLLPPPVMAGPWPFQGTTTVERLAGSIDRLEKHLDEYGTVVAKSPDVWGQARLTKYRQEYEEEMASELESFGVTVNAAITRSDQAFVANALALQAAVDGTPVAPKIPGLLPASDSAASAQTTLVLPPDAVLKAIGDEDKTLKDGPLVAKAERVAVALEPTLSLDQRSRYVNHLHELRRISDGDDKSDAPGYALHLVRIPISVLPGKKTRAGYGAEVTVIAKPHLHEKLLPDTFRGLVINDLVDQWSFPLAKFIDDPKAAEILKKAGQPAISAEQKAFITRNLSTIAQELEKLSSVEVSCCADNALPHLEAARKAADDVISTLQVAGVNDTATLQQVNALSTRIDLLTCVTNRRIKSKAASELVLSNPAKKTAIMGMISVSAASRDTTGAPLNTQSSFLDDTQYVETLQNRLGSQMPAPESSAILADADIKVLSEDAASLRVFSSVVCECGPDCQQLIEQSKSLIPQVTSFGQAIQELQSAIALPSLSTTPSRRSQQPFPISLAFDVHCNHGLRDVALKMIAIKQDPHNQPATLLLDIQKVLAEEFNAAHDYLNHNETLWSHCSPELAAAVRRKDAMMLHEFCRLFHENADQCSPVSEQQQYTKALAWAIIVESALLNERLVEDMGNLAAAKNAYNLRTDWLPYYGPTPPPEAVLAFNEYVCCRWPIHVVAIDPVTQDQNVADSFSQRRELQLALSLAFASGRINAQNFTRMARRLELDMETIALNRTVVGFSHGDDTFGWRFQPRVQSPATKGNIATFAETLFTGGPGRDAILNQSRLEPGIRECTAIVIMPSFVPYVIFDMRTNWFRLTNPARKELDLRDGVGLSAEVTQLHCLSQECVRDAHLYRQDEVYRLTRAVDQLEERLPLQTTYVQMPFENSLGGFEFFNTGTPDLAPELKGFYGEPGISQDNATSIFLVGDHFSVHETKVIVGGQEIQNPQMTLLSRQVMKLTIGPVVNAVDKQVDIHVATPYGISNHLDVPLLPKKADEAAKTAATAAVTAHVQAKHVDKYAWEQEKARIRVQLANGCQVAGVCLLDEVSVKNFEVSPFDDYQEIEFRAWVYTKGNAADAKPVRLRGDIRPAVTLNGSRLEFKPNLTCNDEFSVALLDLLMQPANGLPTDTATLEIEGFLSLKDASGRCQVVRLENKLVLEVAACTAQCGPTPCPPAAASLQGTPFESPPGVPAVGSSGRSEPTVLRVPASNLKPTALGLPAPASRIR